MPDVVVFVLALVAATMFVWLLNGIQWKFGQSAQKPSKEPESSPPVVREPPRLHVYDDRSALGPIDQEFASASRLWVAWISGRTVAARIRDDTLRKIDRLILCSPSSSSLADYISTVDWDEPIGATIATMANAYKKANPEGILKYLATGLFSIVIGNPKEGNGWVRLETPLVYGYGRDWPGRYIYQDTEPVAFAKFVSWYETVWKDLPTQ